MAASSFDFLIVGNSTAAVGAVEAIRSVDKTSSIGVIAHEPEHTYSRPLITYFVAGKVAEDNIYYRPADFYERNQVELLTGLEVTRVVRTQQLRDEEQSRSIGGAGSVEIREGEPIFYRKAVLLAAGGAPIVPPVPGTDRPGVFFMNTIDDARRAKGWLAHASRAVVVGAGLTGLKTAEALAQIGQEVTVVEMMDRVLATTMDETGSELVKNVLVKNGVEVLNGVQMTAIEGSQDANDAAAVALSTGERLACDSVFLTIGVRARTSLVDGSGIDTNRGILVDRHMRTNVDNIYAAGDIAEAYDPLSGGNRVVPILPNAYIGGRVAGMNMAGAAAEYNVGMAVNSVSFFGEPFMSAGFATESDGEEFRVVSRLEGDLYRKFVIRNNKLVGMIITGDVERAGLITGAMRAELDVSGMENALLTGEMGLICLPREMVEERIHGVGRNWL